MNPLLLANARRWKKFKNGVDYMTKTTVYELKKFNHFWKQLVIVKVNEVKYWSALFGKQKSKTVGTFLKVKLNEKQIEKSVGENQIKRWYNRI